MKYCIHCGKEIKDTAAFCPYCGKKTSVGEKEAQNNGEWKEKLSYAKEIGKSVGEKGKQLGKSVGEKGQQLGRAGLHALKEERASDIRNEYRIVKDDKLRRGIIGAVVLAMVIFVGILIIEVNNGWFFSKGWDWWHVMRSEQLFLFDCYTVLLPILESVILFLLLVSMIKVKKTYLSDYLSVFLLNILIALGGLVVDDGSVVNIAVNILYILLAIIVAVIFGKILRKENKKVLLLFLTAGMMVIGILGHIGTGISTISLYQKECEEAEISAFWQNFMESLRQEYYEEYGLELNLGYWEDADFTEEGTDIDVDSLTEYLEEQDEEIDMDFLNDFVERFEDEQDEEENSEREGLPVLGVLLIAGVLFQILYFACLLLFEMSISNAPDKEYISKSEPEGKHIKARSIGFCVVLSILTLGLYYFVVWTYSVISSIRRLEGKRGIALGEWLLYRFVPFYKWYWLYTRARKLSVISTNNRVVSSSGGGLFVILQVFWLGLINMALIQSTLNDLAGVMDKDFVYGTLVKPTTVPAKDSIVQVNYVQKLKELQELKEAGIISEEEFLEKKQQYLAKM